MADTWDDDNGKTLILDWATAERIAATDPDSVVVQLSPHIAADSRPNMLPENPPRSTSLTRGDSYSGPSTNSA
jgi:hypothetical protein